jgi:trypsin
MEGIMIRRVPLLVCVLLVAALNTPAFARVESKIVGGVEAERGEFPFIVSLQAGSHFCGGSLIKKNWVITAGHCASETDMPEHIVIGLHDQRDTSKAEIFTPVKVIRHPKYDHGATDYDFALIQLNGDSKFEPVELNSTEFRATDEAMFTTAGWGTIHEGDWGLPDLLQKVDVPFVSTERCLAAYPDQITDRMICAGFEDGGKDSCQGDSGGPLLVKKNGKNTLVGLVSWGEGCARAKKYGVYSRVSAALSWIDENSK